MNNHWGTNYRAYQEGPHVFRFVLRPHRGYAPLAASRLAIAASQPLLPAVARGAKSAGTPRLQLSSPDVLVTGIKPSDDGQALIVRLWGAAGRDVQTDIAWSQPAPDPALAQRRQRAAAPPARWARHRPRLGPGHRAGGSGNMTACPPAQTPYMQTTRTRIPVPPRAAPGLVSELGRARALAGCEWIVGFIARTLPTILCATQPSQHGEGRLRRRRTDTRLALLRAGLCRAVLSVLCGTFQATNAADFKAELFGEPGRIFAHLMAQDMNTGAVRINGVAMDLAAQPVWDFGDGTVVGSWFPAEHTYPSTASNYVVKVTGFFSDGASNSTEVLVRFAPPAIAAVTLADGPPRDHSCRRCIARQPDAGLSDSVRAWGTSMTASSHRVFRGTRSSMS